MVMGIGNNIKLLRKEKGLTQVQLAALLGTSQQLITAYEREKAKLDTDKLPQLAEILGVSIEVIFNPELRLLKKSVATSAVRKGSRLSKIQELFDKLPASTQRIVLRQVESIAEGS
jgi:transcriptional regulator with XRE-family HTH domain